jgi:hypothetical protein
MTDPIRAALDRLNDRLLPTLFGESVSAAFLQAWTDEARAALAARPPADDDHDRAALEKLLDRVHLAATDPAAWLGLKQGERHPLEPAPAIDFAIQVTDETAYLFRLGSALDQLIYYVHTLAGYSEGVVGLHQNGDLAPWPSLLEGGEFSHWLGDAIAAGRAALTAASPADAIPPAPAASITPDLDALLSPEGAYIRGTGQEGGAQLVSGPHGNSPEWWVPQYGCDSLDNLLDRLRTRILPYLRPPVSGVDVPGGDGDYGGLQELCDAEGVDVRIGAPLLRRARDAWRQTERLHRLQQENHRFREPERTILCDILANGGLLPDPEGKRYGMPAPTPAPALDADTLRKVWREAAWGERWATLVDYIALAVEAQRAPSWDPPATDGEREELARWLEEERGDHGVTAYNETKERVARIATLLRQPAPAVVAVAVDERPWERDGWCDAEGRCWWSHGPTPTARWNLLPMIGMDDAGGWLLPHWAIPIPQPPQGEEVAQ